MTAFRSSSSHLRDKGFLRVVRSLAGASKALSSRAVEGPKGLQSRLEFTRFEN